MGLTTVPIQVPPELFAHHPEGRPMVKSPQSPADAQVHDPRLRSEQEHRLNHQLVEYPRCLGVRIYIYIYMSISHWSDHHLDGQHRFSCACQRGPARGWITRRMLLPFSSFHKWHGRLLPIEYFWNVLLLCRLPLRFPCARTSRMSPCRTFLQNTIPVCRLVSPTSWGRHEVESG